MGNEDLFTTLKGNYNYHVTAFALFFNNGGGQTYSKALRVEAPDIGKEFADNAYIGRDPDGFLYFNNLESFSQPRDALAPSDDVTYTAEKVTNPYDNKVLCKVTFKRSGADEPHAVFLAEDPLGALKAADMDGWSATSKWKPLTLGSVNATIYKKGDTKQFALTASTIHKTATVPNSENGLHSTQVQVDGILHFKDINTLSSGTYANYNDDRVIFYANDTYAKDFVAFFIPYEYSVYKLGYKPDQKPTALTFTKVSWA
ncbi:hypothetical protein BDQ17DRAFT_1410877 [Cyathus striatus]|nr:hypothetical protein BDQ17DRAFT_1410877 [Cyathus striatus]